MSTYTFNPTTKIIQLTSTATLNMQDLYSRWKDAVLTGSLAGALPAVRVVKEPSADGQFIGPYYFTMNNWQIRPVDSAHELTVTGTVVPDATSTLQPFKTTDLTNIVSIVRTIAAEVTTVEVNTGSALTAAQDLKLSEAHSAMLGNSTFNPTTNVLSLKSADNPATTVADYDITVDGNNVTAKTKKV